jgi:hypothetical protein
VSNFIQTPVADRRIFRGVSKRARVIHLGTLQTSGISSWHSPQTDPTPDYLFEKADQCFRRAMTESNMRVELEALSNAFMVKAVELDIKLVPKEAMPPLPPHWRDDNGQAAF